MVKVLSQPKHYCNGVHYSDSAHCLHFASRSGFRDEHTTLLTVRFDPAFL